MPRNEIGRASELLQAQLRQPLNPVPLQSYLSNDELLASAGATGPQDVGMNEFNQMFTRNQLRLSLTGLDGENHTSGYQAIVSGLGNQVAGGLSFFHFRSDGFRADNDDSKDVTTGYFSVQASYDSSFQAEITHSNRDFGNPIIYFDPTRLDFSRNHVDADSVRFGGRQRLGPNSDLLISVITQDRHSAQIDSFLGTAAVDVQSTKFEAQHVYALTDSTFLWGASYFSGESHEDIFGFFTFDTQPTHFNAYGYEYLSLPSARLQLQVGVGYDRMYSRDAGTQELTSPKLGVIWSPTVSTTFRAAGFQVLKRRINSDQGLEPTQVAGFPQYFDDPNGTESRRAGIAVDHRLFSSVLVGVEYSSRRLSVPLTNIDGSIEFDVWTETSERAYVDWIINHHATASFGLRHDIFRRPLENRGSEDFTSLDQYIAPVSLNIFGPGYLSSTLTASYYSQRGRFGDSSIIPFDGSSSAWITDFTVRYKLPRRAGNIAFEGRNIFNERVLFQSSGPTPPPIALARTLMVRATLYF